MGLLEIIDLVQKVGLPLVITCFVLYYAVRFVNMHFKKIQSMEGKGDLNKHFFFDKAQYVLKYKIPHLKISDAGRTMLFKDMLKMLLEVLQNQLKSLINDKSVYSSDDLFAEKLMSLCTDTVLEYETVWRSSHIPEVAIEKFTEWHDYKVQFLRDNMKAIITSGYYSSAEERMASVLQIYAAMVDLMVLDAEKTLKILNGELKGIEYKGQVLT